MYMRRTFVMLIDITRGPRLVGLDDYNSMCSHCSRTQTDKWRMLANAEFVTITQFGQIKRDWTEQKLQEKKKKRLEERINKLAQPPRRCAFCGDILESTRRKFCPPPKTCKSRASYERDFKSLGLYRGPNRIEQLRKWLVNSRREPSI